MEVIDDVVAVLHAADDRERVQDEEPAPPRPPVDHEDAVSSDSDAPARVVDKGGKNKFAS